MLSNVWLPWLGLCHFSFLFSFSFSFLKVTCIRQVAADGIYLQASSPQNNNSTGRTWTGMRTTSTSSSGHYASFFKVYSASKRRPQPWTLMIQDLVSEGSVIRVDMYRHDTHPTSSRSHTTSSSYSSSKTTAPLPSVTSLPSRGVIDYVDQRVVDSSIECLFFGLLMCQVKWSI